MNLSVILPTYNEAENIVKLVHAIMPNIPAGCRYEIVIVDDNSPDGTYAIAREAFRDVAQVVVMLRTTDRGFARSIRAGIERASGDRILVMDTDFTHDPAEIPRLLHVGELYDIVSGSRFCPGGNMQDIRHYVASMVYNWILRIVLRTQVQDNLGGYFTMRKTQLLRLPLDEIFVGYGEYFFRLLYHAQRQGMSIVEIPAVYRSRTAGTSKSRFGKLLMTYTAAAIRLRRRARATRRATAP
jgi:dolichol-phosphate mannosyltransferase